MKTFRLLIILFYFFMPLGAFSSIFPNLCLNEVSQGTQGSQEYVEFVIQGSCAGSGMTTLNLRTLIIDDNDGLYLTGPGANISTGAIRFADIPFWQAIPQGTFIVIYNEADRNPAIPPDDLSIADGNGRLILPANSMLLEGQGTSPTPTNNNYYGPWIAGGGLWSYVSMEDDGDTFKVQYLFTSSLLFHSVSWGTNTGVLQMQIPDQYFTGSATGLVFYVDTHVAQGGWISAPAATSQTPGFPNSANNYRWVYQLMNAVPLQVTLTSNPESCFNACDASVYAQATGGIVPHSFTWNVSSPGGQELQNRCPGEYSVTVMDVNGCLASANIIIEPTEKLVVSVNHANETCPGACDGHVTLTVNGGTGPFAADWSNETSGLALTGLCPDGYEAIVEDSQGCSVEVVVTITPAPPLVTSVFSGAGPFEENHQPVQLVNSIPGGTYTTADCIGCLTPGGIFDPSAAGVGIYQVCYTLMTGACSSVQCRTITVVPCTPIQTSESIYICEGDSAWIFGNWEQQQDIFSQTFDGTTCDSIHRITLLYHFTQDTYLSLGLCEGDSLLVFGNWVDTSGIFSQEAESIHGCGFTKYVTVTETYCPKEAYVYIPNAFTPDGDQVNDVFRIEILGAIVEEGYIYNRWGEIVARFDENHLTWDGKNAQGKPSPDGIYVYEIRYLPINGVSEQCIGHVSLLR